MNHQFLIRHATFADIETIVQFNIAMALETENISLPVDKITSGVTNLLTKPEYGFYMIAECVGEIAGSLMVTTEWSDWRDGLFWWIQSVYVRPDFRRQGVYRALYDSVRALAEVRLEIIGCRLYVERENIGAQETYRKLGMAETHYKMFEELLR